MKSSIKKALIRYFKLRLKSVKLNLAERVGKVVGSIVLYTIIAVLAVFALIYLFFGLGFYLGTVFNSIYWGVLCTGGIIIVLILLLLLFRKPFIRLITGKVGAAIAKEKNETIKN